MAETVLAKPIATIIPKRSSGTRERRFLSAGMAGNNSVRPWCGLGYDSCLRTCGRGALRCRGSAISRIHADSLPHRSDPTAGALGPVVALSSAAEHSFKPNLKQVLEPRLTIECPVLPQEPTQTAAIPKRTHGVRGLPPLLQATHPRARRHPSHARGASDRGAPHRGWVARQLSGYGTQGSRGQACALREASRSSVRSPRVEGGAARLAQAALWLFSARSNNSVRARTLAPTAVTRASIVLDLCDST
eukprot:scaffold1399_cov410-Prasinococcus_capsulatus_cf.AAC.30